MNIKIKKLNDIKKDIEINYIQEKNSFEIKIIELEETVKSLKA